VDAESPWFMETFDENAFVTYLHMQVDAHMNAGNLENSTIHWKLPDNGIVLLELFGGIGTGLAAVLQAGIKAQGYVYVDIDNAARQVAKHHSRGLGVWFPKLLTTTVLISAYSSLTGDFPRRIFTGLDIWIW
jgi:hypothetical protein